MTSGPLDVGRRPIGRLDHSFLAAWESWTEFWFRPLDPAALCLLRILAGGMLFYSHLIWGMDLQGYLGADGWNSQELVHQMQLNQWNLSFWWLVPPQQMFAVHIIAGVIIFLYWIGFLTRLTSVLAFAIHVSYCQRAAMSTYGMDQILGILTMYLMIAPCGHDYSIDALIRHWKTRTIADAANPSNSVSQYSSARLATRLIQFHYCVIYFFAATGKLQGESWWNGFAFWRSITNQEYQTLDLTWLAWFPFVLELITHVTVLWEISFAYLIWVKPLRPAVLLMGVMMHLGIGALFGMWTFGLTMIFGYLAFIEPETIRNLLNRRSRHEPDVLTSNR